MVGPLEEGEMAGIWIQFEDQADGICCWVDVERGERKELKMASGFGPITWNDKANRERLRANRELVQGHLSEMPGRSLHRDTEKTVGSKDLETEEGSWLDF